MCFDKTLVIRKKVWTSSPIVVTVCGDLTHSKRTESEYCSVQLGWGYVTEAVWTNGIIDVRWNFMSVRRVLSHGTNWACIGEQVMWIRPTLFDVLLSLIREWINSPDRNNVILPEISSIHSNARFFSLCCTRVSWHSQTLTGDKQINIMAYHNENTTSNVRWLISFYFNFNTKKQEIGWNQNSWPQVKTTGFVTGWNISTQRDRLHAIFC